ncbi:MAG: Ig-like domain-containing protein [Saprospiraceae bacterium]|nr:Ig-like domain-containing protein [Saprospiraceae bacterium]MBK8547211.1 Ig-like domain-containing protein [Saprospiraceae bacterium]
MSVRKFNSTLIQQLYLILVVISLCMVVFGCASTGELIGGSKDVLPPKIDSLLSTANYQTYFKKQDLNLHFDEYIVVKDAYKQILVSPPLQYLPKVTGRGKKVKFSFHEDEILRNDVTYTINFGEAIVDFREGNKLTNFSYVFSTGAELDSLSVKGMVLDSKTSLPLENVQILLYDVLYDSVVVKERPYYAVKTDKTGKFICSNIKSDTFKFLALADNNANLKYDLETEKIGFLDSLVFIDDSTQNIPLLFHMSTPKPKSKILGKNSKNYGVVELTYNISPDSIAVSSEPKDIEIFKEIVGDSLFLYYYTKLDSFTLILDKDTVKVKVPPTDQIAKLKKFNLSSGSSNVILAGDSLVLNGNFPVKKWEKAGIIIEDTIGIIDNINLSLSENKMKIFASAEWRSDMSYTLVIDSGSVVDIFDRVNDSFDLAFQVLPNNKTSGLNLNFVNFDSTKHYRINIIRGNQIIDYFTFNNSSTFVRKYKSLIPESYTLEIIEDLNQNGIWDAGNYWKKTQPEKMKITKTEKLDINRESDISVTWKEDTNISNTTNKKK